MGIANRRSMMTMYSDPLCPYSHQVRIVLAEKGVSVDIKHVDPNDIPEVVFELNPYGSLPTLIDRDLVLYNAPIIMEYLDERFPHPPLLPVYPVARASSRLMMHRIEHDWSSKLAIIVNNGVGADEARKELLDSITAIAPVFANSPFFLSEEFTLVDACLAPLLWRLPTLGIEIPKSAKAVHDYAQRLFERPAFQNSLSEPELELRAA